MTQYLSPEWFAEMHSAAEAFMPDDPTEGRVSLRETIDATPFGTVTYVMIIDNGVIVISTDSDIVADVTFSQDYETAAALHRGELTTQDAFFSGRVRVAGHLNTLLENADVLQGIAPAFASVREQTTY